MITHHLQEESNETDILSQCYVVFGKPFIGVCNKTTNDIDFTIKPTTSIKNISMQALENLILFIIYDKYRIKWTFL
jgi:hypothetical protein